MILQNRQLFVLATRRAGSGSATLRMTSAEKLAITVTDYFTPQTVEVVNPAGYFSVHEFGDLVASMLKSAQSHCIIKEIKYRRWVT